MNTSAREIFGIRLKEAVEMSGKSYIELAAHLGVNKSTVSMYLHGNALPSLEVFSRIADFLDVSCDFLLGKKEL